MGRKFGKVNVIKVDPLAYNIGLIGEGGIGKTTLAKETCEKLAGKDGYIIMSLGKEDGVDAIAGAVYESVPDWEYFDEMTQYIIDNKQTEYKDLKVLVYDTLDQLIDISEKEVIRLHNRENPTKQTKTINGAFGGFGAGQDKVIEIITDRIWELKNVGVSMFLIGHTKTRTMSDVTTGIEYDMLTTDMPHRYFNAFKNKLHVLGVASVDRNIETESYENIMGKLETKGKIASESRIITFRDNNFNIDSKSRFENIEPQIELNSDLFIKAIEDAIKAEHDKQDGAQSVEDTKVNQAKAKEKEIASRIEEKQSINIAKNEELITHIKTNVAKLDAVAMQEIMKEYGFKDFTDPSTIKTEALEKIKALIK